MVDKAYIFGEVDSDAKWGEVEGEINDQTDLALALDSKAPRENGFLDRSQSAISFDDATRTATISATGSNYEFFVGSVRYVRSSDSIVIPDSEGLHYIYYGSDGAITHTQTFTLNIITDFAFIMAVYWDADNNTAILIEDERHGATMDSATHAYNHVTFGTRYEN